MQYLKIENNTKLKDLSDIVGNTNVQSLLVCNNLDRNPYIGKQLQNKCNNAYKGKKVSSNKKQSILNSFVDYSDVFEYAYLQSEDSWKALDTLGTFPGMLKLPETLTLPNSTSILGTKGKISDTVYRKAINSVQSDRIDPTIFNHYNSDVKVSKGGLKTNSSNNVFYWFKIPWGELSLYSSLSNDYKDFPVYPEQLSDSTVANYTQMPDMLYQYEPWQVYTSSGPRTNTYTFDFHRDMWTGDHRDGKANELRRFCEANCYPDYNGSSVNTSTVTLYLHGKSLITGVMTGCNWTADGPIGLDGYPLHCILEITIVEVSDIPLNYKSVKNKPLIG